MGPLMTVASEDDPRVEILRDASPDGDAQADFGEALESSSQDLSVCLSRKHQTR
jgi:hypothetical protein